MVALMDVEEADLWEFYERETGYDIACVPYVSNTDGGIEHGEALLCTACTSDAHADSLWRPGGDMEKLCAPNGSEYAAEWMRLSLRPLWPEPPLWPQPLTPRLPDGTITAFDRAALASVAEEELPIREPAPDSALYPAPGYLRGCYAAHRRAGLLDHFLDTS